jgi:hypothetical protein
MDGLVEFPAGSVELLDPADGPAKETTARVSVEHGEFASLAAILFMINGHRPGPMPGFYVVVEAVRGTAWAVGQMHADATTPLRVFTDRLYANETEARAAAQRMRLADVGNAPPRA